MRKANKYLEKAKNCLAKYAFMNDNEEEMETANNTYMLIDKAQYCMKEKL